MPRAFCVHGHFYQPPREDPLTGMIPKEPGAAPYPNWNERIDAECYKPNARLCNFGRISFNIGPTLMSWLAEYDPDTLASIVEQDRSTYRQHGVGNAMAQPYNHTILPLATRRDKMTQVRWGIADFEYRFGHPPLGMWLPETAVDMETLAVLADCGIGYTILAPWQAEGGVDTTRPYRVELPRERSIAVFFYNQDLSTRISFDPGSTTNADLFVADLILPKYRPQTASLKSSQLILVASDGELYGHHQQFRDQFLARLVNGSADARGIQSTFPGLWLKTNPPEQSVHIREGTSWSCSHGVSRWKEACSCTAGSSWKAPLRQAFDSLAVRLEEIYASACEHLGIDAWELRDQYVRVLLNEVSLEDLVNEFAGKKLPQLESRKLQLLLKAQYERQRLFTSCGWFFDDFDRIEPKNTVAYAAQAVWLTRMATGDDLAPEAVRLLAQVKSERSGLQADVVFTRHMERTEGMNSRLWQG